MGWTKVREELWKYREQNRDLEAAVTPGLSEHHNREDSAVRQLTVGDESAEDDAPF
jgi:hypothetical protein